MKKKKKNLFFNIPDECKSTTFSSKAISRDVNVADLTTSFEHASQILRRRSIRKIIHFQGNHPINTRRWSAVTHFLKFLLIFRNNKKNTPI